MSEVVNPFITSAAARRYRMGRPDYSDEVGGILSERLDRAARALDVGCGTGISTRAIQAVADAVVGVDASVPMLQSSPGVGHRRVAARAERLPFRDASFDLITVGSALHWFDIDRFAAEAERVAMPDATLVVHSHWFAADMSDAADFSDWFRDGYLGRYPSPPRNRSWGPPDDLGPFPHRSVVEFSHRVDLARAQLIDYFTTQSNLQIPIAQGAVSDNAVREWLGRELEPWFPDPDTRRSLRFDGYVALHGR